jgi:hypothetical protein
MWLSKITSHSSVYFHFIHFLVLFNDAVSSSDYITSNGRMTLCHVDVSRKQIGKHFSAEIRSSTNRHWRLDKGFHGYENQSFATKLTYSYVSMAMWIPRDRLGTERVSVSADKQQHSS